MESPVVSPVTGIVRAVYVQEKQSLAPGGAMLAVEVA
jgi:urea carboxylase